MTISTQSRDGLMRHKKAELVDEVMSLRRRIERPATKSAAESPSGSATLAILGHAIEDMSEGFALFDADDCLVLCNGRYRDMYGYSETDTRFGTPVSTFLRMDMKFNSVARVGGEALIQRRLDTFGKTEETFDLPLADGRWVQIRDRKTAGGGTVCIHADVTDSKRAEEELAAKEAQIRLILGNVPAGISCVDRNRHIVFFNDRYLELWDIPKGTFEVGDPVQKGHEYLVRRGDYGEGEVQELILKRMNALPFATEPQHYERTTPLGRILDCHSKPLESGEIVYIYTDITERRRAENELAEKERQFRVALDNMPGGIRYVDRDKRYVFFNDKYSEMYDFPEGLLKVGDSNRVENLFQAERGDFGSGSPEELTDVWLEAMPVDSQPTSWERTTPQGKTMQVNTAPTPDGGVVNIVTDISDRKKAEIELADAKKQADEASRAKSSFLASMSHEIRTPLSGITGFLELLQYSGLDDDQRSMVRSANLSARYLIDLIGDVLDFSKIEAGHLDLKIEQVSPRHLLDEAISVVAPLAQEKLVDLLGQMSPHTPVWIDADATRLRQILVNLVSNAVKFSENGVVHIDITTEAIERVGGWQIRFEVTDTGIGFDPVSTPDLLTEFLQADDTTTRRFGGTGLGLAIAKRLVEMMGGEIGYDAKPDHGAFFWFTLPIQEPSDIKHDLEQSDELSILLLGDDQDAILKITTLIEEGGHKVVRDAPSKARGAPKLDAVVLIDKAPGVSADEFKRLSDTRILLTSERGFQAKHKALKEGFTHILPRDQWASSLIFHICEAKRLISTSTQIGFDEAGHENFADLLNAEAADLPILVIDDIKMNRQIAGRQLDMLNLKHEFAANGELGLAKAKEKDFAAVIVDVSMPVMDGYEFTRHFRIWEEKNNGAGGRRTPVVALTANVTADDAEKCIAAGMDDYLSKPLTMMRLSQMLMKWLGGGDNEPVPEKPREGPSDGAAILADLDQPPIDLSESP